MDFTGYLPKHLQPGVDIAVHDAELEFLSARKAAGKAFHGDTERLALFAWVKSIFFCYAEQACQSGREDSWTGEQIRRNIEAYLDRLAFAAENEKSESGGMENYDRPLARITVTKIKETPDWEQLQDKLKEVAKARVVPRPPEVSEAEQVVRFYRAARPDPAILKLIKHTDNELNPGTLKQRMRFPNRAVWLAEQLEIRKWDRNRLEDFGGPDHKTTQKVLDGLLVHTKPLHRVVRALNSHPRHNGLKFSDIPTD